MLLAEEDALLVYIFPVSYKHGPDSNTPLPRTVSPSNQYNSIVSTGG